VDVLRDKKIQEFRCTYRIHLCDGEWSGTSAPLQQSCSKAATETLLRTPTAASCIWCRRSGVVTLEIFFFCAAARQ
jgi:hypothetical protein